jgi:Initiator Replication protein
MRQSSINFGKRTPEFSVEGFREYIGLKINEYAQFEELSKFCIKKPIKKINESELSDIEVGVHYYTKGRKVIGLYFSIESRNQLSLAINTDNSDDPFMLARVPIPMTVQTQYLKTHTLDDAKLCIEAANEWIDAKIKAGEPVVHGRAYRSALEGNWQPNKPALDKQVQELDSKKEEEIKANLAKKAKQEAEEKALNEETTIVANTIKALSQESLKQLIEKVYADNSFMLSSVIKRLETNKLIITDYKSLAVLSQKQGIEIT